MLALVISETIKGNRRNGIAIALSPLITDLPIILISIFLLKSLAGTTLILAGLSIIGGLFVAYLGVQNLRFKQIKERDTLDYRNSLKYGVIANVLSPHPYLFWITIGAPLYIKSTGENSSVFIAFLVGFYIFLIGSKISLALLSEAIKGFIHSTTYKNIMKFMGIILIVLAFLLIFDGLSLLS